VARKKKPVDGTPICDPAYLRRIDPVWMPGPVPFRFWQDRTHRHDYLIWLAHRLGLRTMEDFYGLKPIDECCRENYGRTLLHYWGSCSLEAVQDCFPEYDWTPWLFARVPKGFWDLPANRRSYLSWLGNELGFRRPEDWYRIQTRDIECHHGSGLLTEYSSLYNLMQEFLPQLDWDRFGMRRPIYRWRPARGPVSRREGAGSAVARWGAEWNVG
jgi:hypothetical protein